MIPTAPTCSVGSDVLNVALNGWPGVTGRRGQKGAVGMLGGNKLFLKL
jgi:hypothetical protein